MNTSNFEKRFKELPKLGKIRPVTLEDSFSIFNWRNDPLTIENSISGKGVLENEHILWYSTLLSNSCDHGFMGIDDFNVSCCFILFHQVESNQHEISINVNPNFRGIGYGSYFMKLAIEEFKKISSGSLVATILDHNLPSEKMFANLGFIEVEPKVGRIKTYHLRNHVEP